MRFLNLRRVVSRRPLAVVVAWVVLAAVVGLAAPNLTRLAAEGQANLLPSRDESVRVGQIVARAWPDQAYQSVAVVALHREPKLTTADKDFARRLAAIFDLPGRPRELIRVMGPHSAPEMAARLVSHDGPCGWCSSRCRPRSSARPPTGGRLAQKESRPRSTASGPRARGALDGGRGDRPRLHERRPEVARPRGGRDGRAAADGAAGRLPVAAAGPGPAGRRSASAWSSRGGCWPG